MEFRNLELKVMSANNLQKVTLFSKMSVYVVVSISGDKSNQVVKTPVDRDGGTNPAWNFPVKFAIDEAAARNNRLTLVFKLRCRRALGDKDVGEVVVPIKELIDSPAAGISKQFVSYQVRKPSGKPKGHLTFCYQFVDKSQAPHAPLPQSHAPPLPQPHKADEPVMAYPPAGYGYVPPPPQPSYGYPPQPRFGYPEQTGFGYPLVQQPARKNKFGMGLGAGLLGGALGGMLIGDAISDAAAYDAGYNDGFDGGFDGGFDF